MIERAREVDATCLKIETAHPDAARLVEKLRQDIILLVIEARNTSTNLYKEKKRHHVHAFDPYGKSTKVSHLDNWVQTGQI